MRCVFARSMNDTSGSLKQAYGIGVEGAGLVERLEHAEPHLIGGLGTDDGVRTTVIGEVESGAGCVSVQGWILHVSIVNAGIRRLFERGSLRDVVFSTHFFLISMGDCCLLSPFR